MDLKVRYLEAGTIRAVLDNDKRTLEILAAPFGSIDNKDRLGQFLTSKTDFMLEVGDRRPTIYMHGFSPNKRKLDRPTKMGTAEVIRVDHEGVWMKTELDDSELATRTWEAALRGEARASTGSVNYLERHDEITGEVFVWPIAELSIFDDGDNRIPVSDDAVVIPLRAYFDECDIKFPDMFEAGEDKNTKEPATRQPIRNQIGEIQMTPEEIQALADAAAANALTAQAQSVEDAVVAAKKLEDDKVALRASVIDELKADPKYRAVFSVIKETVGTEKLTAEKQETHEYIWSLRHGGTPAMRVLEETEAAEGLAFVPEELDAQVQILRDEISLVSALGIERRKSNRLIYNFIREDSGMGALALIAEEGAYVANEPAFALLPATVSKFGSMIVATEELLEDQSIFQTWFIGAVARKWALAENTLLFDVLKAGGTVGTSSATFTTSEIDAFAFTITEPWAADAHLVMLASTMANIRGKLVATPRAYGEFPAFGGREFPSFMGFQTHLNTNWEAVGSGAGDVTMTLVHPQAVGWVERAGISVLVDPYGDAVNGRTRFFPRVRFTCVNTQALGVVHYKDA